MMLVDETANPEAARQAAAGRLAEIDRQRRHLWVTACLVLVVVSSTVALLSYWFDLFPESLRDSLSFEGWRFAFLVLSLVFIVYAFNRERRFEHLTRILLEEKEELVAVNRRRSDFIASVTHELKTPLTAMLGYASILRRGGRTVTDEQREDWLSTIERQGQRILRLIEEMLQTARLEDGLPELQRVRMDVPEILARVATDMSVMHGRHVVIDAPASVPELYGDPAALEHVVTNLVDNALKYSPKDSVVTVMVEDLDEEVLVSVLDDGAGIPAEELPHVFDRFNQAGRARGRASVGMGLYIVKNLVRAQGGRVWAESELGKGTRFTLALPRRRR